MVKHGGRTFKRLFSEVFRGKGLRLAVVFACIIISALVTVFVSSMIETLIDDYVTPLITGQLDSFAPLFAGSRSSSVFQSLITIRHSMAPQCLFSRMMSTPCSR